MKYQLKTLLESFHNSQAISILLTYCLNVPFPDGVYGTQTHMTKISIALLDMHTMYNGHCV